MRKKLKNYTKKEKRAHSFLLLVFLVTALYFTWRLFFTLPFEHGPLSITLGSLLLLAEGLGVLETVYHMYTIRKVKIPVKPEIPPSMFPDVDVLIATHNESADLLYKTVNGCLHMAYPDKAKVHIYLCDDSDRPEIARLAKEMGVGYFGLRDNQHAKAGNLNNALQKTNSPLVATLDADMIPTSAFLMETVPFFSLPVMILDENGWRERTPEEQKGQKEIGFVQTPQSFYNEDLFQMNLYVDKNVPNEQDYFFREVNVGRTVSNTVIYCGSNTLISRKALEEVGYIATGSITEDFATGMSIQALGYQSIGLDKELVHGLSPTDVKSLFKQRQRWARGCVQTIMNRKFLFGPLPFASKLSYIMSLLYWWTFASRLIFIAVPILTALFGLVAAQGSLQMMLLLWLPYNLLYSRATRIMSGSTRSTRWNSIIVTVMFPYLILPMILETIGVRKKKFFVTPKTKTTNKNATLLYAIPHIILAALSILALSNMTNGFTAWFAPGNVIVAFWLVVNLYALLCAIVFYIGRVNYRKDERVFAKIPATLYPGRAKLYGVTSDISDGGLAIVLDGPEYLPAEHSFPVRLRYKEYRAVLRAQTVHVQQLGDKWKYSLRITHMEAADKSAYLQMVYDRNHSLPTQMKSNLLLDTYALVKGLFTKGHRVIQKLPRIELNTLVNAMASGLKSKIKMLDFSYESLTLQSDAPLPEKLAIELDSGLLVQCSQEENRAAKQTRGQAQYRVHQWQELAENPVFREKLFAMVGISKSMNGFKQIQAPHPVGVEAIS